MCLVDDVAVVDTCFGAVDVRARTGSYPASVAVKVVQLIVSELVTAAHKGPERKPLQIVHMDGLYNFAEMHEGPEQREEQGTWL